MPAKEWFDDELGDSDRVRVSASAKVLENSWRSGRPDGSKWTKLTDYELHEFVATSRKAKLSLRMFGYREGKVMWVASGIAKKKQTTDKREIKRALSIVEEHKAR